MLSKDFDKYTGKIRFIYIDPPYNTSNQTFAYNDKNNLWKRDILLRMGCAKRLLHESGVIFISIDNNELANLLFAGYEIFGKDNMVGILITKQSQRSNAKHINTIHEYIVCFAKNKKKLPKFFINRIDDPIESEHLLSIIKTIKKETKISHDHAEKKLKLLIDAYVKQTGNTWIKNYNNIDAEGNVYFAKDLSTPGKPNKLEIDEIGLTLEPLKTRGWSSREKFIKLHNEGRLCFKKGRPYEIEYLHESVNNIPSILDFYSRQGTNDLKKLGLDGLFDTPKPVELIKFLIRCSQGQDSLILDFYAGSGTTAQAVYEVNSEDSRNHKYILVQLDEPINPKSDSYEFLISRGVNDPTVDKAMILRIDTYLEKINKDKDYTVEKIK